MCRVGGGGGWLGLAKEDDQEGLLQCQMEYLTIFGYLIRKPPGHVSLEVLWGH